MLSNLTAISELGDSLPVSLHREKILRYVSEYPVVIIESPTGSGKTTQLPRLLYEAGYAQKGRIGVTQPRRISTVSVTEFIQTQLSSYLKADTNHAIAAYKMRFDDTTDSYTAIKVMTDGMLLQEFKHDTHLSEYSAIIVDEAHERSLTIDFILGLLKGVLRERFDFRVIVSSATINAQAFSEYFDACPILQIKTPVHPVEILYRPFLSDRNHTELIKKIKEIVLEIHHSREHGDILIFLSGEYDIRACISVLLSCHGSHHWQLLPLYARLSQDQQHRVFQNFAQKRKIVVATNIAETSITIPGINFVIDSGLAKISSYNTRTITSALTEKPIARSSCHQRRGRAGRTGPGVCYRLYSEQSHQERSLFEVEEINRTDLSEVILRMAEIGISQFENFDFITSPGRARITNAVESLGALGALDLDRRLTEIGRIMTQFPISPRHSRIIVEAIQSYPTVIEEALIATSFLSVPSPFVIPEGNEIKARLAHDKIHHPLGDLVVYLELFHMFQKSDNQDHFCEEHYLELRTMNEVLNTKQQLEQIVSQMGIPIGHSGPLKDYLCAVSQGLIQSVCISVGSGRYRSLTSHDIFIHPGSTMYRKQMRYMVAGEIVRTSKNYARTVSPLQREEVRSLSPDLLLVLNSLSAEKGTRRRRRIKNQKSLGRTNQHFLNDKSTQISRSVATQTTISLWGESFSVKQHGSKRKMVSFPWNQTALLIPQIKNHAISNDRLLRGKIILDGLEIMAGSRLNALFTVLERINPLHRVSSDWPRDHFQLPKDTDQLIKFIDYLLYLSQNKPTSKKIGFLTLETNNSGAFWLVTRSTLKTAAKIALSSLETLTRSYGKYLTEIQQERLKPVFQRVKKLL